MADVSDHDIKSAIRMWNESGTIGVLVTGPDDKRQAWAFAVWPEVFDGRGKTNQCFIWFRAADEVPRERLAIAVEAAKKHDVTLQLLCVGEPIESSRQHVDLGGGAKASIADMREWYPVLHLGSDGMKWPHSKRKAEETDDGP